MLDNILTTTTTSVSITSLLICALCALLYGFIIALTHKFTSKYNKNFLVTVTVLPLIVMSIIFLVNGNLGMGIAVAGTFSLVRFRSLPGTSKEILTIFMAMAIGLALGAGYVAFAGLLTLIGSIVILILCNTKIFDKSTNEKILKIQIPEDLDYTNVFDDILKKYTKKYTLESVKTINLGSMFELKYNVLLSDKCNEKEFIDEIRIRNGNLKINLSTEIGEGENL